MFVVNPLHKRCLALAKALLKEGPPSREDLELVKGLVLKAYQDKAEPVNTSRYAFEFYIRNKVSSDLAWSLSGMENVSSKGA